MAARGRFGRSDTGASNLSSLIRQLVSQQQAMEEKALMDAFYNGLSYNGAVPTMSDVQAFYKKYMDLTGITPGDAEYNLIQQKVEGANNFDIKRTYNDLKSTFESTNGANFADVMNFLNGRAKESTDPQDANAYQEAYGVFASNYIKYRGNDLVNGLISLSDYRSASDAALSLVGKDNPIYGTMLTDSYTYEWNSESSRLAKLVQGGKMSQSAFLKWAKSFESEILAGGVSKTSALYADIVAQIGQLNRSVGGSAARVRFDQDVTDISKIWGVLKGRYGGGTEKYYLGKKETASDIADEINKNPQWSVAYSEFLKSNPNQISPVLTAMGITADNFLDKWEQLVSSAKNESQIAAAAGAGTNPDKWAAAAYNNGVDTAFDYVRYVADQWNAERSKYGDSPQMARWLDGEYAKFMNGKDSYFGNLGQDIYNDPQGKLSAEQWQMIRNEYDSVVYGAYNPGMQTVSGYGMDASYVEGDLNTRMSGISIQGAYADAVTNGSKVLQYDSTEQLFKVVDPRSAGIRDGQLQVVATYQMPDGTIYSNTQVIYGQKIKNADTNTDTTFFSFLMPDGSTVIADESGKNYDPGSFTSVGDGTFVASGSPKQTGDVQRVYIGIKDPRGGPETFAAYAGDSFHERYGQATLGYSEKLRSAASAAVAAANGVQDPDARKAILGDNFDPNNPQATIGGQIATSLIGTADQLAAQAYAGMTGLSQNERAAGAEYGGNDAYANFLRNDVSNYVEIKPDVWQLKPGIDRSGAIAQTVGGAASWLINNPIAGIATLPLTLAAALPAGIASIAGEVSGFGKRDVIKDFRSDAEKSAEAERNKAMGLANNAQQIAAYEQTGYNTAGANPFFRNLGAATTPAAAPTALTGTSTYLSTQATVTPPVAAPKPVTKPYVAPKVQGPSYGKTPTTPPNIISSGPRAGQPAGGGL